MATSNRLRHHYMTNTALPYEVNSSPVDTTPVYAAGNNVLTSVRGYAERRPGFAAYTADNFSPGVIARFFTWQRWNGAYYVMMSVVDPSGPSSKVYKLKVGTDTAFQLIHTDPTSAEPFDYVVSNNFVFFGNGTDMKKFDGTLMTWWGIALQPSTVPVPSATGAGNVANAIGHTYVYTYGNSATGYVSDISLPSVSTTSITTTINRTFTITGSRCGDPQCDKIHVYRTEDGGSVYLELSNSPIANPVAGTWSIVDNDADQSLQEAYQAPLSGVNNRPTASKLGAYFQGRIWTFANDTLYFSGYEEITAGNTPEENFPLPPNNTFTFGDEIIGVVATQSYILVFCANKIWRVSGDSLATFRRDLAWSRSGVRNRACITSIGDTVIWLDSSNVVRATSDGVQMTELSMAIRPDIAGINQAMASIAPYDDGIHHWVVLMDGGAGKLRVYDVDSKQWTPPWSVASPTAIGFGETAAGAYKLFLGRAGKPLVMTPTAWLDEGASYAAFLTLGLVNVVEDGNPAECGELDYVSLERNGVPFSDVKYLTDEDPAAGTYQSIFANAAPPAFRTNGTALVEQWFYARSPAAKRVSIRIDWAAANSNFILYSIDVAHEVIA